jgi:hypothetical protein
MVEHLCSESGVLLIGPSQHLDVVARRARWTE